MRLPQWIKSIFGKEKLQPKEEPKLFSTGYFSENKSVYGRRKFLQETAEREGKREKEGSG